MRRIALLLVVGLLAATSARAAGEETQPFTWSPTFRVAPDSWAPPTTGSGLDGLSCAAPSLCVAVDDRGYALTTTDPASGEAWRTHLIDPAGSPGAVSCPAETLCVAGDDQGRILTSSEPGAVDPTWTARAVTSDGVGPISCPTVSLCVAFDGGGSVLTSTDPTGGPSAWRSDLVDAASAPVLALSCPSTTLCVAIDAFQNVLTSSDPTGGAQAWSSGNLGGLQFLTGLSCPSTRLCLAIDLDGNAMVSTAPAGGALTWHDVGNVGPAVAVALSCPRDDRCLVAEEQDSGGVTLPGGDLSWIMFSGDPTAGDASWSATAIQPSWLTMVSCASAIRCVAIDAEGRATVGEAAAPNVPVDVRLNGEGDGTVVGPAMSCPTTCRAGYPSGSSLTFTAIPAAGATFAGWSGACTGTGPCDVTVAAPTTLSATFAIAPPPPGFDLSVSVGGRGSVSGPGIACPPRCLASEPPSSTASLAARPATGWHFEGWSGDCGGTRRCTLRMTADHAVSALFGRGSAAARATARPRILAPTIDARHGIVRFAFDVPAQERVRCALVRLRRGHGHHPRPHWTRCRSPKSYARLTSGRYAFYVRATNAGTVQARRTFTLP